MHDHSVLSSSGFHTHAKLFERHRGLRPYRHTAIVCTLSVIFAHVIHSMYHWVLVNPIAKVTCTHGKPKPNHLGTLYAQSRRVTLAPPVLPRLLAQDLAGTCLSTASCHSLAVNKNFTVSSTFIILISVAESSFSLIVQDSSLLPTSSGLYLVSVTMWLCILQDQL